MDTQGPDVVRPWVERAGATFPTLVDQEGLVARNWGFKVVPNAWVFDEAGVLRYQKIGGFHIANDEDRMAVLAALALPPAADGAAPAVSAPGGSLLDEEVRLLTGGDPAAALESWFATAEADMDNMIVRKQIWYLLHPEKFKPEIDAEWQREQRAREATIGVRAANPIPERFKRASSS